MLCLPTCESGKPGLARVWYHSPHPPNQRLKLTGAAILVLRAPRPPRRPRQLSRVVRHHGACHQETCGIPAREWLGMYGAWSRPIPFRDDRLAGTRLSFAGYVPPGYRRCPGSVYRGYFCMADRCQFGLLRRGGFSSHRGSCRRMLLGLLGRLARSPSGSSRRVKPGCGGPYEVGLGIGGALRLGADLRYCPEPSLSDEVVVEPVRVLGSRGVVCYAGSGVDLLDLGPDTAT